MKKKGGDDHGTSLKRKKKQARNGISNLLRLRKKPTRSENLTDKVIFFKDFILQLKIKLCK